MTRATYSRTKTAGELRIASLSDIHLGHDNTPTQHILDNLRLAIPDNLETSMLDVIILAGDVFDKWLKFTDPVIPEIELWAYQFLRMCKKLDILVLVLEGTNTHDWKQSNVFVRINNNAKIHCDLRYIDKLHVEYFEKIDSHILFVPDNLNDTTDITLRQVKNLLESKSISKVDFAVMHGHFTYQLPEVARSPKHDTNEYLQLVDKLIFIGHDHHFSRYERIIAHGSFDRLAHGEEGAKGHVRAIVRDDRDFQIEFRENTNARVYKTIDCTDWSIEKCMSSIADIVKTLPTGSNIRLRANKGSPISNSIELFKNTWPGINWSKKIDAADSDEISDVSGVLKEGDFVPVEITKENILDLTLSRVSIKTQDTDQLELVKQLLNEAR